MTPALVVHGHFYQPPRENPWTDIVEREAAAHPFHDWNERIRSECYRPNGFARIVDAYGRIERIVNNYANISFNFGPTLLAWLERHHRQDYDRILEADRKSVLARGGHGNAIAQAYNHSILPLCNERDRRTQVRWGIAEFRHRFGREPESLWLPETGCDDRTLGLLIDEGLRFVILSPYQAEQIRPQGATEWQNVSGGTIDTTAPYRYMHPDGSGRSISIFFYDGQLARAIAFEGALASSQGLVERFERAVKGTGQIVNVATDGESYGHHYPFGDRCLAYALAFEARSRGFWVTNYGEFLDHCPPIVDVEIRRGPQDEGTAWSCAHGVGRWYRDCGCQTGAREGWNQAWRGPLRSALDTLRDYAAGKFELTEGELFKSPWKAREAYINLLIDPQASRKAFLEEHAVGALSSSDRVRALTFLELQRNAMLMYTSCGWFFSDISGIETVQILKYAGRVMDYLEELGVDSVRDNFLGVLSGAKSNILKWGNGADIYRRFVEPSRVPAPRVAAHIAISSLVDARNDHGEIAGYEWTGEFQKQQHGRLLLTTGRLGLESTATGRRLDYAIAAMHFGDVDFYSVLKPFPGEDVFKNAVEILWARFRSGSLATILRVAQQEFGVDEYGLEHLLPGGRERISEIVFGQMVSRFSEHYELLFEDNRRNIEMLQEAGFELPTELRAAAEFTIGRRFEAEILKQQGSPDPMAYSRALEISDEVTKHGYKINKSAVRRTFEELIARTVGFTLSNPSPGSCESVISLIKLEQSLGLEANLDEAQEAVYEVSLAQSGESDYLDELRGLLGLSPNLLSPDFIEPKQQPELDLTEQPPAEALNR